jgi:ribosome biogenesis GTPase / thiamine phosphate phosphatase
VKDEKGRQWNARIKGIFRIDDITSSNPLAVGDEVEIEIENEGENTATIIEIHPRKNYINRQSPGNRNQHHIIAANLDQAMMIATLKEPRTSQGFIDRFLVTSEAYHIPAIIVFNKADLYKKKEMAKFEEMQEMYTAIGYKIILMSVVTGMNTEEAGELLRNKTSLLSGHSGVGKSSFINNIFPGVELKTKDVSDWSGKGMHTTTFAEMFDLPGGGRVIDTPGLREFGIVNIGRQELSHYFPEMRNLINECHFNNCMHLNEPGCAIKEAVSEGRIHEDRYISYATILETINEKTY